MKQNRRWALLFVSFCSIAAVLGFAVIQKYYFDSVGTEPAQETVQYDGYSANAPSSSNDVARPLPEHTVSSQKVLHYQSKLGPLPGSLDGTVMAQSLVVDESGHLRVSSDIKRVFDYFLSTIEEESLETILARIDEYLQHYLNEPALGEAKLILSRYIDLKKALYDFELERSSALQEMIEGGQISENKTLYLSLLEQQLLTRNELRAAYLSPEIREAFYADEEQYDQYTLARMHIFSDDTLSEDEKAQQLEQIDAQAPPQLVQARQKAQVTDILKARTAQLHEQGADQSEIRALRTQMLGPEAATRFETLDKERAQWKQRIAQYLLQRSEILTSEGLSLQEREQQVDNLRASLFDSREQIRVGVLESRASS